MSFTKMLFIFTVMLLSTATGASQDTGSDQPLTLFSRSDAPKKPELFSAEQQHWLTQRQELRIGVFLPYTPPYAVSTDGTSFEGMTADIIGLVSGITGLEATIIAFPDRETAAYSLSNNTIDAIANITPRAIDSQGIRYTVPYLYPQIAVVTAMFPPARTQDQRPTFSYSAENLYITSEKSADNILAGALLEKERSAIAAVSTVAFGGSTSALLDNYSAQYIINQYYPNDAKITQLLEYSKGSRSFALRDEDSLLGDILDKAITEITDTNISAILDRWDGGGVITRNEIIIPKGSSTWVENNTPVRIGVHSDYAPYSYFDRGEKYSGITADILNLISVLTGIEFEAVPYATINEAILGLNERDVDLLADFSPTPQRRNSYIFSRPYLSSPYAIVAQSDFSGPVTNKRLSDLTIALPRNHSLIPELMARFPDTKLHLEDETIQAYYDIERGEADILIQPLRTAKYFIARQDSTSLEIKGVLSESMSTSAFASLPENASLIRLLDVALMGIQPDELGVIENRWRTNPLLKIPSWSDYQPIIKKSLALLIAVALGFIAWNYFLRTEVRKRKRAESDLSDQLEFMSSMINDTPHPIYVIDKNTNLTR